jgi:hypothetical protein
MRGQGPGFRGCVTMAVVLLAGGCAKVVGGDAPDAGDTLLGSAGSVGGGGSGAGAGGSAATGGGGNLGAGLAAGAGSGALDAGGPTGPSADGPNCGLERFAVERLPPDVLIVLDKSTSMLDFAKGILGCLLLQCNSKWTDMTSALKSTVTATQGTVSWGLKLFPSDSSCGVTDAVTAPVAPNNASAVNDAIDANKPSGSTPTRLALESGGRYLMGLTTPNPRFVVLATDGQPNCAGQNSGADDMATIAAVASLASAGIPVFVIGVGIGADADATLSAMATAGGKPRQASPTYYPVATSADLSAALSAIGGQIVSCTLPIKEPPDPTNIAVDADGMRVPRSPTEGWDYGANGKTIQLSGTWCTNYQNGMIKDVQTIFGCPGVVIP